MYEMLFFKRNLKELSDGGFPVFFRKLMQLIIRILLLPVLAVILLVKPFVRIRFGCLISDRIGHLAGNTEIYLCEKDAGRLPPRTIDFFHYGKVCNYQLLTMLKRRLNISNLTKDLFWLSSHLPSGGNHLISLASDRDVNGYYRNTPPHLSFTDEEEKRGQDQLKKYGVSGEDCFICFHARDTAYLDTLYPGLDWSYHDYRNENVYNYLPALEEMSRRGLFAFRMGAIVSGPLKTNTPGIIDYASIGRSEFMDIYLSAKCRFFVGSGSGIIAIPMVFRRPIVWVNQARIEHVSSWGTNDLTIFKKLWLIKEKRFMTIREILDSGTGSFSETNQFKEFGIELIENTLDEIMDVTVEMYERLKGTWQTGDDDEELQKQFWGLLKSSKFHGYCVSRIGANFLRQNQYLLD